MELLVMVVLGASLLLTYKTSGYSNFSRQRGGYLFYVTNFAKGLETIPYMVAPHFTERYYPENRITGPILCPEDPSTDLKPVHERVDKMKEPLMHKAG